ncbi:bifunctional DNA primase/polymerase [Mycolicibacterium thermoresistibile]
MTPKGDRPGAEAGAVTKPCEAESQHTGYGAAAALYRNVGWRGVIPVPYQSKKMSFSGWTGESGGWPTDELIQWWSQVYPAWNIALRLPDNVLGLDIDAYKPEATETMGAAFDRCGDLPVSWCSTSRDDGSGIYLYRVPEGIHWKSTLGCGVEIVRRAHRYAMVWPSIHPEGRQYRWVGGDGVPQRVDLPELPDSWIAELTVDANARSRAGRRTAGAPAYDVEKALTAGHPLFSVGRRLGQALADLDGPSRHDKTCRHVLALLGMGSRGQPGVAAALEQLRDEFVAVVGPERDGGEYEAADEFDRMVFGAGRHLGVGVDV